MWKRLKYLIGLFVLWVMLFALQKPLFMLYNRTDSTSFSFTDVLQVMRYGLKLDATMTGYLIIVPFLALFISIWCPRINWKRGFKPYFALVGFIMALGFLADALLYPFWGFKLDATVLNYMDSPKDMVASVSTLYILISLTLLIALSFLYYKVSTWKRTYTFAPIKKRAHQIYSSLGMLLVGGVIFVIIRGGFAESTANVGHAYYSDRLFLNHSAVNPCFSFLASLGKSDKFEDEFDFYPEEQRAELFNGLYHPEDNSLTDTLLTPPRPNILIIQLESFGGIFVEPIGGIKDVTPQLNRLTGEGTFFTNFYANSFRTDRGTVCTFSGYLGLPTASVMKMPVKSQTLSSIAQSLKTCGYTTDFLYGGDIDFTNMRSYLLSNGYQHTTGMEDFSFNEQHTNAWGVNDDITFDWLYNQIINRKDSLWHTGFLTLSSHEPFEVPYSRLKDERLNSVAYTDHCLGLFIDKLKKTPQWKNLLIICLPDHSMRYEECSPTTERFYHVPMLWLGGAIRKAQVIDRLMNQSDLAATLLAQLNLPHQQYPFSRNVFGTEYNYPFAFSCFSNGFLFKDSTGVTLFDNDAEKTITDQPEDSSHRRERLGKAILQTLYDDLGQR